MDITDPDAPGPLVGRLVDVITLDIERGKIAEFARATGTQSPLHTDAATAAQAGLADIAATATHVVAAGHQRDPQAWVAQLGLARERIVVGSVSWEYLRPLVAGDRVTGRRTVTGDQVAQGSSGSLRIITLQTDWTDDAGVVTTRQVESIIERGAR